MKIPAKVIFNIYLLIAILTFGHAMSGLDGRTFESVEDRGNSKVIAALAAPAWPFYWAYKVFSWGRTIKVTLK